MRIAVATSLYELAPDVKRQLLESFPDCKFRGEDDELVGDEIIEYCQGYEAAIIGHEVFDDHILSNLPGLKVIAMTSTGVNHIDPAVLKKHGIRLGWFPGVNRVAVAEMTISQMIDVLRNLQANSTLTHAGQWPQRRSGILLQGKTIGIHGCGNIGKEVAKRLIPFEVTILACDRVDYSHFYADHGIESVEPEELWARSDLLTIHLSLNATTRGLYTAEILDKLKPGAYLVNMARGGIVDEQALYDRLTSSRIAGAAFDVFAVEPAIDHPLFQLHNFIGTPHCASNAIEVLAQMAISGVRGLTDNWIPEPGQYPFD